MHGIQRRHPVGQMVALNDAISCPDQGGHPRILPANLAGRVLGHQADARGLHDVLVQVRVDDRHRAVVVLLSRDLRVL